MEKAWHFCAGNDGKPVLRDGTAVVVGKWLTHTGPLEMCKSGYHASTLAIDALDYAPGPVACLVEVGGTILRDTDKLVAMRRRALWAFDATDALRLFARQCALDVAYQWETPTIVREYLETGDEDKSDAAWAAASAAAAWDAARAAAWDAASAAAAWAAARAAAWDAARAAAWDAASDAAWAAASAAARAQQNRDLESLLYACAMDAGLMR